MPQVRGLSSSVLTRHVIPPNSDKNRINKGLTATHATGSSVVLHSAATAVEEANFIASQIKHLVAHTGSLLDYGDFAILLRYGALSRNIEQALQRNAIPSRMVGGHKFFDRAEIRDTFAYLQLADNLAYAPAFARAVGVPKRGVGEKTIADLLATARIKGTSAFECAERQKGKKGLQEFTKLVRELREKALAGTPVTELIELLCDKLSYKAHLERTDPAGFTERWENIEELKAYAVSVQAENPDGLPLEATALDSDGEELVAVPTGAAGEANLNHLGTFLAISMLATDTDTEAAKEDAKTPKVTISTCHSAKGLEWPVVYVPCAEEGIYPFYRSTGTSNEVDEERRLMYVAITRAQAFCSLSWSRVRQRGAETHDAKLSPFLAGVAEQYPTLFVKKLQKINEKTRREVASVLGRPAVAEEVALAQIAEHEASLPPPVTAASFNSGSWGSRSANGAASWPRSNGPTPTPANAGFTSALANHSAVSSGGSSQASIKAFGGVGRTLGASRLPGIAGIGSGTAPANYASKINQRSAVLGAHTTSHDAPASRPKPLPFKRPRFNNPVSAPVAAPPAPFEPGEDEILLAEAEADQPMPLFRPASPSPPPEEEEPAPAAPAKVMAARAAVSRTLNLPETRHSKGVTGVQRYPLPPPPAGEVRLTSQGSLLDAFAKMEAEARLESRVREPADVSPVVEKTKKSAVVDLTLSDSEEEVPAAKKRRA